MLVMPTDKLLRIFEQTILYMEPINSNPASEHKYKIVKINSYNEFLPYRRLGKDWCISYGEDIFNVHAENGICTLFLLIRDDVHHVEKKMGAGFPKDDYGLSIIAVFVRNNGQLESVTSRWNSFQEGDSLMTSEELKALLGDDFKKLGVVE